MNKSIPLSLNYEFDTRQFEYQRNISSNVQNSTILKIDANTLDEPNILDSLGDNTTHPQINKLGDEVPTQPNELEYSLSYFGEDKFDDNQKIQQIILENITSNLNKENITRNNLSQNNINNQLIPNFSHVANSVEDTQHDFKIVNVVASFNLSTKLDLQKIQKKSRNCEYNPRRFPGLIMRIKEPSSSANMFSSGKCLVMGAKDEKSAKLAARKFARIIFKLGYNPKLTDFKITNIVSTFDMGFKINLTSMATEHSQFISYEPELFSGLIFKMLNPKVTVLIYHTGKLVIIGAKTNEQIKEAVENITPVVHNFKA